MKLSRVTETKIQSFQTGLSFTFVLLAECPYGQIPILEVNGDGIEPRIICQSGAIARYLARKFGKFYGANDEEKAIIDDVIDGVKDYLDCKCTTLQHFHSIHNHNHNQIRYFVVVVNVQQSDRFYTQKMTKKQRTKRLLM